MPLVIGLTGGIASGKTTVANLFHDHFGIQLVDADIIAREVVEAGTEGLQAIADHFGTGILTETGELNRARLREKIFSDQSEKEWLNNLLHPMIRQKMQQALTEITSPYALLVIPLLVENQLQFMTDRILVVDVSKKVQIERTMHRDKVSLEQVESILASQASREERLEYADDIIVNNCTNNHINNSEDNNLLPQVTLLHKKYLDICNGYQRA